MKNDNELENLIKDFNCGNTNAMAELFRRLKDPLFRYLFAMCRNLELSEDLLQETLILIWKNAGSFDITKNFMPWAFAIARNKFFEWRRRESKIIRLRNYTHSECVTQSCENRITDTLDVSRILDSLPEETREAFLLKHFYDLKFHEISEIQAIPVSTVKSRVLAASRKIRARFGASE